MLGVQSLIDSIDESIVGRVLNVPEIESVDGEGRKRNKGWWVFEEESLKVARTAWERKDKSRKGASSDEVGKWVGRVLDLARGELAHATAVGVTLRDLLDYVRPGGKQGRQRLASASDTAKPLYVDVSLAPPMAISKALRRIPLLVLATELSGKEEYAKAAALEVRRWVLGEGMTLPPSVLTTQRKGLDQRAPTAKQHLMAASSHLPAFLDALRILGRDGRIPDDVWVDIRQVLATMLRFLLASDISRDMDLKSRDWESVRGDAAIASLAGFLGDVRSWNRIITGARMRIGGSLGFEEGCIDVAPPSINSSEDGEQGENADDGNGAPLGSAQAEDRAMSSAGKPGSQVTLGTNGKAPVISSADTFLDDIESKARLLQWWTTLARIFESGYGRFRANEQDRSSWADPTPALGNLAPSLWHIRTNHAQCKNVSVSEAVRHGLKELAADVERAWGLWGMSPDQEIGSEDDLGVLVDDNDEDGGNTSPTAYRHGAASFANRHGIEPAILAKQSSEARRVRLRLVRARLQYIAQTGLRLEAVKPLSPKASGVGPVEEPQARLAAVDSDMDLADFAASNRLRLKLYDDEPAGEGWMWEDLWVKQPVAAFHADGAAAGATMDLPFAWMLGLRN